MIQFHVERSYLSSTTLSLLASEIQDSERDPGGSSGQETGATHRVADVRRFGAVAQRLHAAECCDLAGRLTTDRVYPTRGIYIDYDRDGFTAKHVDAGACDITVVGQITECDSPIVLHSSNAKVQPVEVHLLPGDVIAFRGSETPHERLPASVRFLVAVWCFGGIAPP